MRTTTRLKNIFKKKPKAARKTGYYWVWWSYSRSGNDTVWRVGYYNQVLTTWTLDGDERRFYDQDFLGIDPRPIPGRALIRLDNLDYAAILTWIVLLCIYIIIKITSIII